MDKSLKKRNNQQKRIQVSLQEKLVPSLAEKTTLTFAKHQNSAGLLGIFYHFKQKHLD